MNIYCSSDGTIIHVDPERVFQGSVGVDVVRFIGRFPSSAQVLMAYKLPNGTWTSPKMLTPVAELEEIQDANGGTFAVWEGRIGASPKIDENGAIVKDENGNVVFDLDYTITENYGTATIQFFVYGATASITVNGVIQNVGNGLLATASFSFEIEKGVPAVIPEVDTDDAKALLTQILNVVANTQTLYGNVREDVTELQKDVQDLDKNKVNKSGDTMNGPLVVESQSGPGKVEVSEQGVFVTNNGENGTAYDDGAIVNQGKKVVIPLKDGTMALAENVVASVELQLFELDYKLTLRARAADTRILSESTIDLPLESMVVGGAYNDITHRIELTLQNGNVVSFPVDELVNGLISSSEKGQPNGVASLDAEGKVPKEQLPDDIGGGGGSLDPSVLAEYVKFTDYPKDGKAGVVQTDTNLGTQLGPNGKVAIYGATLSDINSKTNGYKPIVSSTVEHAVKVGITTNTETLTDEEKASACEWVGAVKRNTVSSNGVYGKSGGAEILYNVSQWGYGGGEDAIARRTNKGGLRVVLDETNDKPEEMAVPRGYLDAVIAKLKADNNLI